MPRHLGDVYRDLTVTGDPATNSSTEVYSLGDIFIDTLGAVYCCTASGKPGTWQLVAEQFPLSFGESELRTIHQAVGAELPEITTNPVQGVDNVANRGKLFTKDMEGVTELFYFDDQGALTQITSDGQLANFYRSRGSVQKVAGSTTLTYNGLPDATLTGTLTSQDDASGTWIQHATAASANADGGILSSFDIVRRDWLGEFQTKIKLPSTLTTYRLWAGLWSATPVASDTPSVHLAAFRYSTSANDSTALAMVSDSGSGTPEVDFGTGLITANAVLDLRIALRSASVDFFINGVLYVTHSTKIPTATQLLGYGVNVRALAASARSIKWGRIQIAHN